MLAIHQHSKVINKYAKDYDKNKEPLYLKACVCYFSLFFKDKCISLLFRMKYIKKKFNLVVFSSHCLTNMYSPQGYHALPASSKLLV